MLDLVLVGGGLANGLIAWRLLMTRPDVSFAILEAGPTLGGNHTWSFHGTDVTAAQLEWLWVLCSRSWPAHDVVFQGDVRRIGGGYHSIRSEDFHSKLSEQLKDRLRLRTRVQEVTATSVLLESGERLEARAVVDGRGFTAEPPFRRGYQRFLGMDVELDRPHGLEVPLLMDGRVEQLGAFRFLYLLPWAERRVLVEDTSYADHADLDRPALRRQIEAYLAGRGLRIERVVREEHAALPIPLDGALPPMERPTVGVGAGLFHATTGYSLPLAAEVADAFATLPSLEAAPLTAFLQRAARRHWSSQAFFRLLNRMLFHGVEPHDRVKIFASFYQNDDALIGRFYAGRMSRFDQLKVLAKGAPMAPGMRAWRAAVGQWEERAPAPVSPPPAPGADAG
jgi:lycopene beta-cyclase